jgi:hypothetical protein
VKLRGRSVRSALVTIWHINADEPRVLDHREEYQSAEQLTGLHRIGHVAEPLTARGILLYELCMVGDKLAALHPVRR